MVSSLKSRLVFAALVVAAGFAATPVLAQDATVHQIYEAVQAGRLKDAESMIERVVREHPNSAKAHYVAAEVYAREGKLGNARTELAKAEKIDPLLSFASPASIRALRADLRDPAAGGATPGNVASRAASTTAPVPAPSGGFPWVGVLAIGALALGGVMWLSRRRAANVASSMPGGSAAAPMYAGAPMSPAAPNFGAAPYQGAGPMQPAARSGFGGALATAAAVGAGVVAGEAIAHSLMRDDRHGSAAASGVNSAGAHADPAAQIPLEREADFGVREEGGWNDTGLSGGGDFGVDAGGGDDWN